MTYGYVRVSTDKQDTVNQRFEIEKFCKKQNLKIDHWIEETISGTKDPKKRKLGTLIENTVKGDLIICSEVSRLGRKLFMIMIILQALLEKDVKVWTIKDNYRLGDDIQSKILAFAFGIAAEIERDMISQRTKEALARKRAEGILLGRPLGRKSSHNKLTGKEKEIKNLCEHKIGFSAMGRILGVNRMTVAKYCSDNNLITKKTSKNPQSISKLELIKKGELVKLVKAGKTKKEIAALSGVSFSSAVNYIDRNPELRELYENVQDKIRIKKNGGLHINKRHMGN